MTKRASVRPAVDDQDPSTIKAREAAEGEPTEREAVEIGAAEQLLDGEPPIGAHSDDVADVAAAAVEGQHFVHTETNEPQPESVLTTTEPLPEAPTPFALGVEETPGLPVSDGPKVGDSILYLDANGTLHGSTLDRYDARKRRGMFRIMQGSSLEQEIVAEMGSEAGEWQMGTVEIAG